MNIVLSYGMTMLAFLVALTFHECSHALTAYLLGDDTAKRLGRLTLNPLSHIDPIGFLFLILVRIGWAKPVPFNPDNFTHPRLYSVFVGLAGPLSNFILALFFLYALHYMPAQAHPVGRIFVSFFNDSVWINVMLGVFNLLPIPPLDGSHIISVQIPLAWRGAYMRFQQFGFIILIVLLSIPAFQQAFKNTIFLTINLLHKLVV